MHYAQKICYLCAFPHNANAPAIAVLCLHIYIYTHMHAESKRKAEFSFISQLHPISIVLDKSICERWIWSG